MYVPGDNYMPIRKIYCKGCNSYLGEIRDGKLKKDIVFLCSVCEYKRLASDLAAKTAPSPDIPDFFKDMFK